MRPDTPGAGAGTIAWDPSAGTIDSAGLEGVDAVVHLAGAGIADKRWTDERKREIKDSRLQGTSVLTAALATLSSPPAVLVSGSAVGYYGDAGDRELTERSPVGTGFLAEMVSDWEAAAKPAVDAGIRTVFVRTAPVLALEGGMMKYMLTPFRFGLGARFGDGSHWFPWITIDDELAALRFTIDNEQMRGPVNAAAPGVVTNKTFTKILGRVLHRPAPWWAPVPVLEIIAGKERTQEALISSAKVVPAALLDADFSFSDPELEPALEKILSRAHTG